jgi:polyvinyl alcohol dehydrogenase (cytochrome)
MGRLGRPRARHLSWILGGRRERRRRERDSFWLKLLFEGVSRMRPRRLAVRRSPIRLFLVALIVFGATAGGFPTSTSATSFVNWPSYLFGPRHSSLNRLATAITPTNASELTAAWASAFTPSAHTGRAQPFLYGSPTVYDGRVYIGTFDGWFYVLDAATGAVLHQRDLGAERACDDQPSVGYGIGSTATVRPDPSRGGAPVVYVTAGNVAGGTGGTYLWALDPVDLHSVWATDPVTVDTQPGSFAWSSPTVFNGHIYVGVSSKCDSPLVRGKVAGFSQANGDRIALPYRAILGRDQIGGGVWTSVAAEGSAVWATTGNANEMAAGASIGDAYSLVRLDGSTLLKQDAWQLPGALESFANGDDLDFGSSPTLFTGTVGGARVPLIGACSKEGLFYALRRDDLGSGPVWTFRVGKQAGESPFDACIDSAIWDWPADQLVIGGNGGTTVDGRSANGSVRALEVAQGVTQRVIWDDPLPCNVIGSPTENGAGVVAVVTYNCIGTTARPALYLLDARHPVPNPQGHPIPDAPILKKVALGNPAFAEPTFADDMLFVASTRSLMAYHI